jgi:hypothetical protein
VLSACPLSTVSLPHTTHTTYARFNKWLSLERDGPVTVSMAEELSFDYIGQGLLEACNRTVRGLYGEGVVLLYLENANVPIV